MYGFIRVYSKVDDLPVYLRVDTITSVSALAEGGSFITVDQNFQVEDVKDEIYSIMKNIAYAANMVENHG